MTEEQAAACLRELRKCGHDAHLHPVTKRVAIWYCHSWWYVAGGDFERPSLMRANEPAKGPLS